MKTLRSRISGIGMYVPPNLVPNSDLEKVMDTTSEWIEQRTGIQQRYWVPKDALTPTSELAEHASRAALVDAGLEASAIDLIVFATLCFDAGFPGSACYLQARLGLPGIPALDIRQQCTGFLYGLSIADLYVRSGQAKHVLLVGAEIQSKGLDIQTRGRDMAVLFGDGAGAAIVSATEVDDDSARSRESFVLGTKLHADGRYADELVWKVPGFRNRVALPPEKIGDPDSFPQMNGKLVFVQALQRMPEVAREALAAQGLAALDVDLWVNHQANQRINDKFAGSMGVPSERVFNTIAKYGNTTAATIPIGLVEARKAGLLKPGTLVGSASFGSGFTWAASLIRW